ncbi:MAG: hypothetical protein RSC47_02995 [Raoultibacter sp.]
METVSHTMYEAALTHTWERFAPHLSGSREGLILVVSKRTLEESAIQALEKSFSALGWGQNVTTFLSLHTKEQTKNEPIADSALFETVEGIDPFMIVAADQPAAEALSCAYHCEIPLMEHSRLLGRDLCAFPSFSALLASDETKRKAWRLLKSLPKPH